MSKLYRCPSCKRQHAFEKLDARELWDFDVANVFSCSSLNKDVGSHYTPRCSCAKPLNYFSNIFYKMIEIKNGTNK
jgi:hypothetical protein